MKLTSWKCFKCKSECKCDTCLKDKSIIEKEIKPQKVIIRIKSRRRSRKRKIMRARRVKPIQKEKQNIIKINGITIVEIKETRQNEMNDDSIGQDQRKSILDELLRTNRQNIEKKLTNTNAKLFIPIQMNKRERHLKKISNMCENINLAKYKLIEMKCLLCLTDSLQLNESVLFNTINEFFDYLTYLFTYRISTICYVDDIYEENVREITRYYKKSLNKNKWVFLPQIICKGCILKKLNQPKCLEYFIDNLNQTKENYLKTNITSSIFMYNEQNKQSETYQNQSNQFSMSNNTNKDKSTAKNDETHSNSFINDRNLFSDNPNRINSHEGACGQFHPFCMQNENYYFVSKKDLDNIVSFIENFSEKIIELNNLIMGLNQDMILNKVTIDSMKNYVYVAYKTYQEFSTAYISYSQNQSIMYHNVNRLIDCMSTNYPFLNHIKEKIVETKTQYEDLTRGYMKVLNYINDSARIFVQLLNDQNRQLISNSNDYQSFETNINK